MATLFIIPCLLLFVLLYSFSFLLLSTVACTRNMLVSVFSVLSVLDMHKHAHTWKHTLHIWTCVSFYVKVRTGSTCLDEILQERKKERERVEGDEIRRKKYTEKRITLIDLLIHHFKSNVNKQSGNQMGLEKASHLKLTQILSPLNAITSVCVWSWMQVILFLQGSGGYSLAALQLQKSKTSRCGTSLHISRLKDHCLDRATHLLQGGLVIFLTSHSTGQFVVQGVAHPKQWSLFDVHLYINGCKTVENGGVLHVIKNKSP